MKPAEKLNCLLCNYSQHTYCFHHIGVDHICVQFQYLYLMIYWWLQGFSLNFVFVLQWCKKSRYCLGHRKYFIPTYCSLDKQCICLKNLRWSFEVTLVAFFEFPNQATRYCLPNGHEACFFKKVLLREKYFHGSHNSLSVYKQSTEVNGLMFCQAGEKPWKPCRKTENWHEILEQVLNGKQAEHKSQSAWGKFAV